MSTHFVSFASPVGPLEILANEKALVEIRFKGSHQASKAPRHANPGPITDQACDELEKYFAGSLIDFGVPVDPKGTDFEKAVWLELLNIPSGTTISYERLAIRCGDILKIRAVGRANAKNPIPIIIPCHRVIGKDGTLTGYAGGLHRKEWLLEHEGALARQTSLF